MLAQQSDLAVLGRASLVQLLGHRLQVIVKVVLDLFGLLLLEENLVLVVDFSLSEALVALLTHLVEPLLEAHLFRVVEFLQVG